MKLRRFAMLLMAIMILCSGITNWTVDVKADTGSEDVDISEIMTQDALIGYATSQTWGAYFENGYSIINKISSTKIGAGGVTNAAVKCTVKVNAIVEKKNSSGSWERVTSWSVTNQNAYSAIASKSITVPSGYYYRVRSHHYAGSDSATSFTSALWVGN